MQPALRCRLSWCSAAQTSAAMGRAVDLGGGEVAAASGEEEVSDGDLAVSE